MAPKWRIAINNELEPSVKVNHHNGTRIIFDQCKKGLYYFDTTNKAFVKDQTKDYKFLNTVESNKSCFHRWDIKGAYEARILQQLMGWPSTQTLKQSFRNNQIRNYPITTDNISRPESIYSPQIKPIQGKEIRRIIEHHKTIPKIPLPPLMFKHHQNMDLSMNFLFFNESPFLHTKSRKRYYRSV